MKISELQELLKEAREVYGDIYVATDFLQEKNSHRVYVMGGKILYIEVGESNE